MSLMDDIFDVRDALKNKPERASFSRIEKALDEAEQERDKAMGIVRGIRSGIEALEIIKKEFR